MFNFERIPPKDLTFVQVQEGSTLHIWPGLSTFFTVDSYQILGYPLIDWLPSREFLSLDFVHDLVYALEYNLSRANDFWDSLILVSSLKLSKKSCELRAVR